MKGAFQFLICLVALPYFLVSCHASSDPQQANREMVNLLKKISEDENSRDNGYASRAVIESIDSALAGDITPTEHAKLMYSKAIAYLQFGSEDSARQILEQLMQNPVLLDDDRYLLKKGLALTYLRIGEKTNCTLPHSGAACIFPISHDGVHRDLFGSSKAAELYTEVLEQDSMDLEARWLLNIAYMTMGTYPRSVPAKYLIPGLDKPDDVPLKPFIDVSMNLGLNTRNVSGGSIIDDFDNDGYYDVIISGWNLTSPMHYFSNLKNGRFIDASETSGLSVLTGGSNIMQTDYNNDGLKDIFVLRGAWKGRFGKEPNSLLRNNGDGTFTDVTKQSGLLSFHPTQTATWNDFNRDGWLDVFIGNEASEPGDGNECELYLNNGNGTFTSIAVQSNTAISGFIKGVTSGDYDNDGWPDIFISTMQKEKYLLKNEGVAGGGIRFKNVTESAGIDCNARTFSTWFWDYDNDGWLDLFIGSYEFRQSLGVYAAAEALHEPIKRVLQQYLYHNNHDGTFTEVGTKAGLNKVAFAMGANFGDINSDGYPDIYMGTGNPNFESLVPNKMFLNQGGKSFADVTSSGRLGNLQKGHGISFADLDNDGDEDIFMEVGGAFDGDAYQNAVYINPGQNDNKWINISLEGTQTNRVGIGARIKVSFKENGVLRSVCRDVNSGGNFGASPLTQHIGVGKATTIDKVEIIWPVSKTVQVFSNLPARSNIRIKEGTNTFKVYTLDSCNFLSTITDVISCGPPLSVSNAKK